jgi:hypothetical protein
MSVLRGVQGFPGEREGARQSESVGLRRAGLTAGVSHTFNNAQWFAPGILSRRGWNLAG